MIQGRAKVALTAFALVVAICSLPWMEQLEQRFYDIRMHVWMTTATDEGEAAVINSRIRLISVEDTSVALGWSDANTSALLWELKLRGASAVVVCGPEVFADEASLSGLPEEALVPGPDALLRRGSDSLVADPDGLVRSLPAEHECLELAQKIFTDLGQPVADRAGRFPIIYKPAIWDTTDRLSVASLRPMPVHRFQASLAELPDNLEGTVFLFGKYSPFSDLDYIETPLDDLHSMEFLACVLDTYFEGWRPTPIDPSLEQLCWLIFTLGLCFVLSGRAPLVLMSSGLGLSLALFWVSFQLFPWEIDARPLKFVAGAVVATLSLMALEGMRAQGLLADFGGREDARLEGQETTASILFTILPPHLMEMEKRHDEGLLAARRQYNDVIQRVCQDFGGRVLDYQGDAQMIGFGLRPGDDPLQHPIEAAAAALAIVERVDDLADIWQVSPEKVEVHVGICTGPVALGHVGAEQKKDLAAIGDTSNTAARLMGAAMKLKVPVLLSEPTYEAAANWVEAEPLPPVTLKGKSQPVPIYAAKVISEIWKKENEDYQRALGPEGGTFEFSVERGKRLAPTFILSGISMAVVLLLNHAGLFSEVENAFYDWRQRVVHPADADPRIVLVGITEESEEMLGPFPWDRGHWAYILGALKQTECAGVFVDVMFKVDREAEGDQALAQVVASDPRMVLAAALVEDGTKYHDPLMMSSIDLESLRQNAQLGLVHKILDPDQVLRWALLAGATTDDTEVGGIRHVYPAAAVALLQKPGQEIQFHPFKLGDLEVPESGNRGYMRIRFGPTATTLAGRQQNSYEVIDIWRLVDPSGPPISLKDKYVLIGDNYSSGPRLDNDRVNTPVGPIKGVEGHARILDTLLNRAFLVPLSREIQWLWVLGLSGLTVVLLTFRRQTTRTLPLILGLALVHVGTNSILFWWGYVADLVLPVVMVAAITGAVMFGRYLLTRKAMAKFIPSEVVDELLYGHGSQDRRVTATILLTDIRGYTTISETKTAVEMLDILNEYHKRTVACYERHGGQALTYQGDAQIVVFGVFGNRREPAVDGVKAALELQAICTQLRQEWGIERQEDFDVGAGLCTGEVEVGIMGAGDQRQYSVIGETVRTSHKVQGMSDELEAPVIMDAATYLLCSRKVEADDLGEVQPKGLDRQVRLFRAKKVRN